MEDQVNCEQKHADVFGDFHDVDLLDRLPADNPNLAELYPLLLNSTLGACSRKLSEFDVPPSCRYGETSERLPRRSFRRRRVQRLLLSHLKL
jgi:hypothetical protein